MDDLPTMAHVLEDGPQADDVAINLMRVLRARGHLSTDDGVAIMRHVLSLRSRPHATRALEAEIAHWETLQAL